MENDFILSKAIPIEQVYYHYGNSKLIVKKILFNQGLMPSGKMFFNIYLEASGVIILLPPTSEQTVLDAIKSAAETGYDITFQVHNVLKDCYNFILKAEPSFINPPTGDEEKENNMVNVQSFSLKASGNMQISKNFKVREFACKDGTDEILIDINFVVNKLQVIRDHFGVPITINSAYRTLEHNTKIGGAKNSYHMKGQAFDIVVKGKTPLEVAQFAQILDIPGIIQYNTFVHLDSRPNKYWARNDNGKITLRNTGFSS